MKSQKKKRVKHTYCEFDAVDCVAALDARKFDFDVGVVAGMDVEFPVIKPS